MSNVFHCCDEGRRDAVRSQAVLNGIDHLEVVDSQAPTEGERQRLLRLHFVNAPAPAGLTELNVLISGGERIKGIEVESAAYDGDVFVVTVDRAGDFSPYVLRLVTGASGDPLGSLDPLLAEVTFSFKVECPADLDCHAPVSCPPDGAEEPELDRLAKDYQSFRRLMLDRMSLLAPQWKDRSAADLGVMMVELLSYTADHLSYTQDAVATEAYLGTARRRTSVRKHARLVDYRVDDGANARVWISFSVSADVALPAGAQVLTRELDAPVRLEPNSRAYREALARGAIVFETMHDASLFASLDEISFYTWGARECCLPRGAVRATLRGHHDDLHAGDVLLFEEVIGAITGREEDADPTHRHVVRLTRVTPRQDPLGGRFFDTPVDAAVDVTDIEWSIGDALPFPLCISSREQPMVSVARGNIVLADHGRTIEGEDLGVVPRPSLFRPAELRAGECHPPAGAPLLPRYRPQLREGPLTHVGGIRKLNQRMAFDPEAPASSATRWEAGHVLPAISLASDGALTTEWRAVADLLESASDTAAFVVEVDDAGLAALRFGDDQYGMRPIADTHFVARYRIGNGRAGNVGAESLGRIASNDPAFLQLRNPLAGVGGSDPEPLARVRHAAPAAFRAQERAVTEADWERVTGQRPDVQRARATVRWTGSWYTVFDTVDRIAGLPVDADHEAELVADLERVRVVGLDLEIDPPRSVPLLLELCVSIDPRHFRAAVKRALLERFHAGVNPDGSLGLFHPDRFTFAEAVYLSPFVASAQSVDGVRAVGVHKFERLGKPATSAVSSGRLPLGRLEIPRLDNDPDYPERGLFKLVLEGGR